MVMPWSYWPWIYKDLLWGFPSSPTGKWWHIPWLGCLFMFEGFRFRLPKESKQKYVLHSLKLKFSPWKCMVGWQSFQPLLDSTYFQGLVLRSLSLKMGCKNIDKITMQNIPDIPYPEWWKPLSSTTIAIGLKGFDRKKLQNPLSTAPSQQRLLLL